MNVLYFHQYFNTLDMPGGTRSFEMARRLANDGCKVDIVTARTDGLYSSYFREELVDNLTIHWLPIKYSNKMGFLRRVYAFILYAFYASFVGMRVRSDLIFATSTPLTIIIPATIVKFFRRIPLIFEVRDLWPETPIASGVLKGAVVIWLATMLERFAYWNSDAIVALSPGMKLGVERVVGPGKIVEVIPNSCDLEFFLHVDREDVEAYVKDSKKIFAKPVILYAGTIGIVNGLEYLVDLAHALSGDAHVLIIGDGNRKEYVRSYASSRGVNEETFFIRPPVPKRAIPLIFRQSSVGSNIVAPVDAYKNNSANKFFDSLAAGKPVLLNQKGWMTDLVIERKAGFFVGNELDEFDLNLFRAALVDGDILDGYERQALSLAVEEFDRDKIYLRLKSLVDRVCSGAVS